MLATRTVRDDTAARGILGAVKPVAAGTRAIPDPAPMIRFAVAPPDVTPPVPISVDDVVTPAHLLAAPDRPDPGPAMGRQPSRHAQPTLPDQLSLPTHLRLTAGRPDQRDTSTPSPRGS